MWIENSGPLQVIVESLGLEKSSIPDGYQGMFWLDRRIQKKFSSFLVSTPFKGIVEMTVVSCCPAQGSRRSFAVAVCRGTFFLGCDHDEHIIVFLDMPLLLFT